ncbi:MAG: hypothetical protein HYT81_11260 [Gemmatimonadetes bacterium]|nr:hypothetical protein [Gemmatimonadota bacterium]MBI3081768.1 hypothetical protein [Gemmatimonadota bacterium]
MSALDRRRFLKTVATAVPAVAAGTAAACTPAGTGSAQLDARTLHALGQTVLPGELGLDGIQRAVTGFQAWLSGYRPAAEVTHGYGTGNLEYTPAHPGPGWTAQLEALDLEAKERFGVTFAALSLEQRTEMIRRQLARERVDRLPDPVQARHVAVGLLAYWAQTPEATNLCYQAKIDPYSCRPLAEQANRPLPMSGS